MAASLNKAIILGNLGKDPELRTTGGGQAVCTVTVATNEDWTDRNGQKQERTEWHNVVIWGRTAENVAKFLKKGSTVLVEGRIQTRDYQDKDGNKRYVTEIVADRVQFVGARGGGGGGGNDAPPPGDNMAPRSGGGGGGQFSDDEIPF